MRDDARAHGPRREHARSGIDLSSTTTDHHVLDMEQYNLFPNITVLVFADMLTVVRARPGHARRRGVHGHVHLHTRAVHRRRPRTKPFDVEMPRRRRPPRLVINQDVGNFERTQRGLHQPGLHAPHGVATEECRIVNLHRNLEEYLGIGPEDG